MSQDKGNYWHSKGGPRTSEGKAVSSQNARKHGCCSDAVLIVPGETMQEYEALEAIWLKSYQPKDERV